MVECGFRSDAVGQSRTGGTNDDVLTMGFQVGRLGCKPTAGTFIGDGDVNRARLKAN